MKTSTFPFYVSLLFSILLLFFVNTTDVHAQSETYQASLDTLETYPSPHALKFTYGRFDGDETPSIFMLSLPFIGGSGGPAFIKFSPESGTWTSEQLQAGGLSSPYHHYVFDFDRDGFDDIVVAGGNSYEQVFLFRHKGVGGSFEFDPPVLLKEGLDDVRTLLVRDLNNDGFEDLVADNYTWIGINNRGKSLLSHYPPVESDYSHPPVGIYDIDRNGWQDVYITRSGQDGNFFLSGEGIFDLTNPKVIWDYPGDFTPVNYDSDHELEVISLDTDVDHSDQLASFELEFYQVSENLDFSIDDVLTFNSIPVSIDELRASIQKTAIPDSNGADIVFSYTISDHQRIRHYLKVTGAEAEVSSTDTIGYTDQLPYEIMGGKYVAPVSNELEWLGNKPVVAMVREISDVNTEEVPDTPQKVTTGVTGDLLTISWDPVTSGSGEDISYSVYMTNEESGFQYRSDYFVPFAQAYDYSQNRVFNHFKLFENLPGGTYDISIQAVDGFSRRSEKSAPVSVTIENNELPKLPDSVRARAVDAGIEVSFNMASYFDSVLVYRSSSESFENHDYIGKADMHRQNYIDEDINPSTTYTYALKVFLNGEASDFTEMVSVSTSQLNISNIFSLDNSIDVIEEVVSYDLNLDGYKDLIVNARTSNGGNHTVYLLPGSEHGYDHGNIKMLLEAELVFQLKVGDWDGDLQPDLIHQTVDFDNWTYPTKVHLLDDLEITETVTFDAGKSFDTVNPPELLFSSDLDLNGRLDLVYGGFDHIIVAWNDESGMSLRAVTTNGFNTYGTKPLDLNQDGYEDLIVDEGPRSSPVVYVNQKGKSFQRKTVGLPTYAGTSEAGAYHEYLPILFNEDMYPDLLVGTEIQTGTDSLGDVYSRPANIIYVYNPETEGYEESGFRLDTITTSAYHQPIHFNNDEYTDFISTVENELKILVNENNSGFSTLNIQLSSVSWLLEVLQTDTDNDGDQDILFLGYNSPTLFGIENRDEPSVAVPGTPEISGINSAEGGVTIEWGGAHWSNTLDAQTGYGVRISSEERNILVGNVNPATGKRSTTSKYTAFQNTRLEIPELPAGEYSVWVSAYNPLDHSSGFSEVQHFTVSDTGTEWEGNTRPVFQLHQNYPNPFNPATTIRYQIPASSKVTLKVYDITGKLVRTLVDKNQNAGSYQVKFDGTQLASGLYIYQLKAGGSVYTKKLSLVK